MKLLGFLITSLFIHSNFAKGRRLANNGNKEKNRDVDLIEDVKCLYNGKNILSNNVLHSDPTKLT